jgi:hypothetical protein
MRKIISLVALTALLSACGVEHGPTAQEARAQDGARRAQAALSNTTDNSEQDNIERRIRLTSQPGLIGYIVLMNQAGQPIMYTSVKGKVTSSGKRLTAPVRDWGGGMNNAIPYGTLDVAPSDEGTWGSSDAYIYFWTVDGQYIQWKGDYLYSNSPIRLAVQPLVVNIGTPAQPEPTR